MDAFFTIYVMIVALAVAGGGMLLLVGYIDSVPASVAHGWRWAAVTLALPVVGPIYFCCKHWDNFARTGKQLMAGAVLMLLAMGGLYGLGPWFAKRAVEMAGG
ncbi:hypothetical protein AZSI13_32810 [Azospira sp. I13]|uniref:hypothetical protein n=1 Tax=Azospira sp. I13 TaxID=1765050 RepID=UPI000D439276|nr:hypothetical protein [Azospira sp. I13]GBG03954.1 hypothetical protein AZSI13_32810 [Azospira sp. I13]